jgi:hypothetical protein
VIVASPSMAIERMNSTGSSCQAIHAAVAQKRELLLRYTAPSGIPIYNRVVADSNLCFGSGSPDTTYFPSADKRACEVTICVPVSPRRP